MKLCGSGCLQNLRDSRTATLSSSYQAPGASMTKNLLARVTRSNNGVVENEMFWHQCSSTGINMEIHKELMFEAFYWISQEKKEKD